MLPPCPSLASTPQRGSPPPLYSGASSPPSLRPHPLSSEKEPPPNQPRSSPYRRASACGRAQWTWALLSWKVDPPRLPPSNLAAKLERASILLLLRQTVPPSLLWGHDSEALLEGVPDWRESLPGLRVQNLLQHLSWALGRLTSPSTPGIGSGNLETFPRTWKSH